MAHAHDLCDRRHRQAVGIGRPDGLIALVPEGFASLLQGRFALGVVLGEGGQAVSDLGCLAFRSGDSRIV